MVRTAVQKISVLGVFSLLLVFVLPLFLAEKAEAANLQQVSVRLDRMIASTATTGMVCVKTAAADVTEANVVVTFPTGFTVSETLGDWTVTTTNIPADAAVWTGIGTATSAVAATRVVTFPSSNLTANTLYCFNWDKTAALTTGSSGASQTGTIASGGNSSTFSTAIITSGTDQIGVTATVPATFTFSLSANADTFASALSTTAQLSNGVTASISTNASSGWVAWVKSANAALHSASTGADINTTGTINDAVDTLTGGTNGYLLDVTFTDSGTGTGTVTQAAGYGQEYNGNSSDSGGTLSTSFQPIAASSGTTGGDTLTLKELARISAIQAAATDYADTLTVVAAGRF